MKIGQIKAEGLREAAQEFESAALAGLEPELNRLAAKLLRQRAAGLERTASKEISA